MPTGDRGIRPGPTQAGHPEAGYNLVALAILITVMNIAVAAALPYWSSWAQRQKEAELIFRGLQYAEAIRIFRVRQGRLPTALEELVEVEPRTIRQLWPNPMAEDGRWGLLMQGGPSNTGQRGNQGGGAQPATNAAAVAAAGGGSMTAVPPPNEEEGEGPVVGPILGVYSATPGPSMRVFNGQQDVGEWYFTSELIQLRPGNAGDGRPPPRLTSEWIGKPFPPGVLGGPEVQDGTAPGRQGR
jgi:type II secretory pathway pseudopilin PulG